MTAIPLRPTTPMRFGKIIKSHEKAVELYRQVVEREPANQRARTRLGELEAMQTPVAGHEAPAPTVEAAPAASEALLRGEARRAALWRTIRHLEGMLAAVRRG